MTNSYYRNSEAKVNSINKAAFEVFDEHISMNAQRDLVILPFSELASRVALKEQRD